MDVNEASSFVSEIWKQTSVPFMVDCFERQRLGPEVGHCGDWDTVVFSDGTEFGPGSDIHFDVSEALDGLRCVATKAVKVSVPDEAALADFDALLAKWRAEGKVEIADNVEDFHDEYDYNVKSFLVTYVDEVVTREAEVSACRFYQTLHGMLQQHLSVGLVDGLRESVALTADDFSKAYTRLKSDEDYEPRG